MEPIGKVQERAWHSKIKLRCSRNYANGCKRTWSERGCTAQNRGFVKTYFGGQLFDPKNVRTGIETLHSSARRYRIEKLTGVYPASLLSLHTAKLHIWPWSPIDLFFVPPYRKHEGSHNGNWKQSSRQRHPNPRARSKRDSVSPFTRFLNVSEVPSL